MMAYFGARLRSGFDVVAEAVGLRERLAGADLCITGEGRLDASSLHGKTAIGVARLCRELGVPCVAVVGSAGDAEEGALNEGLAAWVSICDGPMTLDEAMRDARGLTQRAAERVMRLVGVGLELGRKSGE